jgi:predicted nucleic acid-binding Zn ribbon protein
MPDDADIASRNEEFMMASKLRRLSDDARKVEYSPCGYCYYCSEQIDPGLSYCDSNCRDDHATEVAHARRNGTAMPPAPNLKED